MKTIDKSIIEKVKEFLDTDNDNVLELFKSLHNSRSKFHPDLYDDETSKKLAEEKFKNANSLLNDIKAYIEQQQASNVPVLKEANNEIEEFLFIKTVDAKDDEISNLKVQINLLRHDLKAEKSLNESLLSKIDELSKEKVEDIHEEIKSIYTPRKAWTNIGLVAILTSLLTTFPIVSNFLTTIGADSIIILGALQLLSFVTLFNWLRSWLINKIVEKIEYEVLNSVDINTIFNVSERTIKYRREFVFYEYNIISYLQHRFNTFYRIVLLGGLDKTIKILTDDIILQLDRKRLIKSTDAEGLNKIFIVNQINQHIEENDPPF